jgi:ribosomal protein S8
MKKARINLLICLKNMSLRGREKLNLPFTKKSVTFLNFLYKEGIIQHFKINKNEIFITLKPIFFGNYFSELKLFSKPSYSLYIDYLDICKMKTSKKIFAVSTSNGLLNLKECYKNRMGGKLLFSI